MDNYISDSDCFPFFGGLESMSERLRMAGSSAAFLKDFRDKLETLSKDEKCRGRYPNIRRHVADAAFEAENHTRLMSKLGLDTVNELRDSGGLDQVLRRAIEGLQSTEQTSPIPDAVRRARELLQDKFQDLDTSFLDEALRLHEQLKLGIRPDRDRLVVEATLGDGAKVRFPMRPGVNPGSKGRVSGEEFFGGLSAAELVKTVGPAWVPEDCHHRAKWAPGRLADKDIDIYGSFVGALKNANELSYLYARRVDEVGTPGVSGRDPVTAIVVGLLIVAAALIIAGAVIEIGCSTGAWSGDVCDFGFWLIVAGFVLGGIVCVASGACGLVLATVGVVV